MFASGDRVLIATSGGPDSTALLAVLAEVSESLRIQIEAAHYNHRLRAVEALRDQRNAQRVAHLLRVPFHVGTSGVSKPHSNIEERARIERYRFLLGLARQLGCRRIATGHTLDDQAETLLMRLLRGSGIEGLAGIAPVRADGIVRPLIECDRKMVLAYLEARGLPFCEDSTNDDPRFTRARVRHELIPLLRSLNPRAAQALARAASAAAADATLLKRMGRRALGHVLQPSGDLSIGQLADLPAALKARTVRCWLAGRRGGLRGIGTTHVNAILRLAQRHQPAGVVRLPGEGTVLREYNSLHFEAWPVGESPDIAVAVNPGDRFEMACGWRVSADVVGMSGQIPGNERTLWYFWGDAQRMGSHVTLRTVRRGDRIEPLGLSGRRKLQDIFVDRKIPRGRRWHLPVLEMDGRIVWVPGIVRSRHALVSAATTSAWRIEIDASAVAGW